MVVTLGEKGVFLASKVYGIRRIPAVKVKAVDTTAAGDAFTAALAYQLLEGRGLLEAAEFANLVSAGLTLLAELTQEEGENWRDAAEFLEG